MANENNDRRVRRTKSALRKAMISLMTERKINEITVIELCELADINRGTFYLHYRDMYDLHEQIEDEIYNEIVDKLGLKNGTEVGDTQTLLSVMTEIFRYLTDNHEVCTMLLGINRSQKFFDKLAEIGRRESVDYWVKTFKLKNPAIADSYYEYTVFGCIALLKHWLEHGRCETTEELARRAYGFIVHGLSSFTRYGG